MILESVHLRGAAGHVRVDEHDGREHLVLPCVALIGDQIIHAVNSQHPEKVPIATLLKAAASFNLKPVVLGHPVKNGKQCSASTPDVAASHCIGVIKNSRVEGKKLLCEAWIDPVRAEKLGSVEFVNDLRENKPCDVSVGAFVTCDETPGELDGKKYSASWLETLGDHLAILWPHIKDGVRRGRGACSWESGCGLRAAMHLVTAEAIELDSSELIEACEAYQVAMKARYADCETCNGTGQVKDGESQKDCPTCEGAGEIRAAAGARHNTEDVGLIQAVHDHATALGATCETKTAAQKIFGLEAAITPQLKAACRCEEESTMTKEQKAVLIAALVTDKHSSYKAGDEAFLEGASDARLEEFKTAAEANKTAAETATKQENDLRAATAKLTVIEGKLKAAEATPTEEEWLTRAPSGIKTLLESQKAQETELREDLVKQLKSAGANTEDELKAMPTAQLQTLAKYAKVQTPDFSGRGIPVQRFAQDDEDYTPPDPYEAALKTLKGHAVN